MNRNQFIDPATGAVYTWASNHLVEDANGRQRQITQLQPTAAGWADVQPTLQQGATTPRKIRLSGRTLTDEQHQQFLHYWALSKKQTVHFHHGPDNVTWEVLVNTYESQRIRLVRAPRGGTHIFSYTLELEVITTV